MKHELIAAVCKSHTTYNSQTKLFRSVIDYHIYQTMSNQEYYSTTYMQSTIMVNILVVELRKCLMYSTRLQWQLGYMHQAMRQHSKPSATATRESEDSKPPATATSESEDIKPPATATSESEDSKRGVFDQIYLREAFLNVLQDAAEYLNANFRIFQKFTH